MATLTVYSAASDGWLESGNTTNYTTARTGNGIQTGSVTLYAGQNLSGSTYFVNESFLEFDTSALPDDAPLDAVVLSLYGFDDDSTTDFTVQARLRDWGGTLETSDWVPGANLSALTLLATFDTSGYALAYNDFTDVALLSNISATGTLRFLICSDRLVSGTAPTGPEYVAFRSAEQAGTTQDPRLVVTYTPGPEEFGEAVLTDPAGSLVAAGSYERTGAAALSDAEGQFAALGAVEVASGGALDGEGVFTASGAVDRGATSLVVGDSSLAVTSVVEYAGEALLGADGSLSAAPSFDATGVAVLVGDGSFAASASSPEASALLVAEGSLAALPNADWSGQLRPKRAGPVFTRNSIAYRRYDGAQVIANAVRYENTANPNLANIGLASGEGAVAWWGNSNAPQPVLSTEWALHGTRSVKVQPIAAGTAYSAQTQTTYLVPATPGVTYAASVYIKHTAIRAARLGLYWLDATGANISNVLPANINTDPSGVTRLMVAGTAPANTVSIRLIVRFGDGAATGITVDEYGLVDAVQVEVGSGATMFQLPGTSLGSGVLVEEGTSNLLTTNQSNVETDMVGLTTRGSGVGAVRDTSEKWEGAASCRVTMGGTTQTDWGVVTSPRPAVTAGQTYSVSVYVKGTSGQSVHLSLAWRDSGGALIGGVDISSANATGSWERRTRTMVAPTGAVGVDVIVGVNVAGGVVYVDGLQVENKAYTTSWQIGGTTRALERIKLDPTPAGIFNASEGSAEVWVYDDGRVTGVERHALTGETAGFAQRFRLWKSSAVTPNGGHWRFHFDSSQHFLGNVSVGWHHIAVTWSGGTARFYLDGVLWQTFAGISFTATDIARFYVGSNPYDAAHFNERIAQLRVRNKAMTAAEVAAVAASGAPSPVDAATTYKLTLNNTMEDEYSGDPPMFGVGELAAFGGVERAGDSPMTDSSGTFSATGVVDRWATASMLGESTIAIEQPIAERQGEAVLMSVGELAGAAVAERLGAAVVAADGHLAAVGNHIHAAGATLTGDGYMMTVGAISTQVDVLSAVSYWSMPTPTTPSTAILEGYRHYFTSPQGDELLKVPSVSAGGEITTLMSNYKDMLTAAGGFIAATGEVPASIVPNPASFFEPISFGAEWKVQDLDTGKFIWAGTLRDIAVLPNGIATLAGDGWGKKADRVRKRVRWMSRGSAQFTPAESDEYPWYDNDHQILPGRQGNQRIYYRIVRGTTFKRNDEGSPTSWKSGMYSWTPGSKPTKIQFDIDRNGKPDSAYTLELVGATGPDGALTGLDSWSMGSGGPSSVTKTISPALYDLIGLRLKRTSEIKKAPGRKFTLKNIRVYDLAETEDDTLDTAFRDIFEMLGAELVLVQPTANKFLPLDAERVTLGQIADELAVYQGRWYWRMSATSDGRKKGEAGKFGDAYIGSEWQTRVWEVVDEQFPITILPVERFNEVVFDYKFGDTTMSKKVTATANPFPPDYFLTYNLDWEDPPRENVATVFAQEVVDYLVDARFTGSLTATRVRNANTGEIRPATDVEPGDKIRMQQKRKGDATKFAYSVDGGVTPLTLVVASLSHEAYPIVTFEFATGSPLLDKWLSRRKRRMLLGDSRAEATIHALGLEEPKKPTGVELGFERIERRNGTQHWVAIVDWNPVTEDVNGEGTAIRRYHVELQAIDPDTGQPAINPETGNAYKRLKATAYDSDGDPEDDPIKTRVRIPVHHPHKLEWRAHVDAEDVVTRVSGWTDWTPSEKPASFGPRTPSWVTVDVDQHKINVKWDDVDQDEPDEDDDPQLDRDVAYYKIRWYKNTGTDADPVWVLQDTFRRKGNALHIKVKKPGRKAHRFDVKVVDGYGNTSPLWASGDNKLGVPPAPAKPAGVSWERGGRRGLRPTVHLPAYTGAYADDDIAAAIVFFQVEDHDPSPSSGDRVHRKVVHVTDEEIRAGFSVTLPVRAKRGQQMECWWRVRDTKGHVSDPSPDLAGRARL